MTPPIDRFPNRRGVLLLVVLSMLTLFLLLGTAYLVTSTRSRVAARAFNRLVMQSDSVKISSERYLDNALLYVLRGGAAAPTIMGTGTLTGAANFESLLEDKYGRGMALTGTAATVARASGTSPLLLLQDVRLSYAVTGTIPLPTAPELPGRVLTLVPDHGPRSSHRIIHATGPGPFTLYVDNPARTEPFRMPKGECPVVVNGREFDGQGTTNEPWDAFDNENGFLAHIGPSNVISSSTVSRGSYLNAAQTTALTSQPTAAADNDNDGQKDGAFLTFGFPGIPTASGTIDLHASVLIVDLDSRFNVNAHGSLADRMYQSATWPTVTGTSFNDIPLGSGYGPPEVNGTWMLRSDTTTNSSTNMLGLLTGGTSFSVRRPTAGSRFSTNGSTPSLQALQGRYGEAVAISPPPSTLASASASTLTAFGDPMPGQARFDDLLSRITDQRIPPSYDNQSKTWAVSSTITSGVPSVWWTGANNYDWRSNRGSFNSPPDLHGRMKTVTGTTPQGIAPSVYYAKPEWGTETTDDPYELELGQSAKVNGWMDDPNTNGIMPVYDNIYSTAELEPVLRPYDSDTFRLPLRLSATLGVFAEEARFRATTSSWDTTAITGTAAANLQSWLRQIGTSGTFVSGTSPISGTLGGEALRGERFDLNRPLTSQKPANYDPNDLYYVQRQAYFKDLYTLLCAILHPSGVILPAGKEKEYAQWAANVVEFRDADSTITPFEYDGNPLNGWTVDGNAADTNDATTAGGGVVWGAERPELLIMETSAWEDDNTGELFITLHRPWNAQAVATTGTVAGEPIDPGMDAPGSPQNQVDLGRKAGNSTSTSGTAYPIWRLRIDDGTNQAFVRFDAIGTAATSDYSISAVTTSGSTPTMATDSWLCLYGQNTQSVVISASGTAIFDKPSGKAFRAPGPLPVAPVPPPSALPPARRATVYLERLTDPSSTEANNATWALPLGSQAVPHYHVVDQAPIEVVNRLPTLTGDVAPLSKISRDVTTTGSTLWKCMPASATGQTAAPLSLGPASFPPSSSKAKWFPWPNRPFVSPAELFLVPGGDAIQMLQNYTAPSAANNALRTLHSVTNQLLLLDAVHVPTRFAGIHSTITSDTTGALRTAGIYWETTPVNQLSSFREPGRVNLNTVTADDVWDAVVAGPLSTVTASGTTPAPLKTRVAVTGTAGGGPMQTGGTNSKSADFATSPATSIGNLLALQGATTTEFAPDTHPALVASGAYNPADLLYTANRLANTTTIRSNVFAVWITLRESIQNDPDSVKYHRAFYIVDRSIPVAHEAGKDHNVWDSVILRRIIE